MMRPQCDCCGYLIDSWGTPGSVREVKTRDLDDKGWEFGGQFCELCFAKAFKNLGWDYDDEDMEQVHEERGDDVNPRTGKLRKDEDEWYAAHRETFEEQRDKGVRVGTYRDVEIECDALRESRVTDDWEERLGFRL